MNEATRLVRWNQTADEPIRLTDAEQMVDELDRILTAYGTISVKTPDVWGQDRLAKFRSEYEAQMAAWLKVGFKGDINASVRRAESESTLVQVGHDSRFRRRRNPPRRHKTIRPVSMRCPRTWRL